MNLEEFTLADGVSEGARWMDTAAPGWAAKVDPNKLRMDDAAKCVMGQAGLDFPIEILKLPVYVWDAFSTDEAIPYWAEEISKRLAIPKDVLPKKTLFVAALVALVALIAVVIT